MKFSRFIKYLVPVIIFIILSSTFSSSAEAKKPEGSPCYQLLNDMEIGSYEGNILMETNGGLPIDIQWFKDVL